MTPEEIEARRQQQEDELMNADYPIPDPAWDYAAIWQDVWQLQQEASRLIREMQETEAATPESDAQIRERLKAIAAHANHILSLLD